MDANFPIIILVIAGAIVLVIYLIFQNRKDRKDMEKQMNADFKKPEEQEMNNDD